MMRQCEHNANHYNAKLLQFASHFVKALIDILNLISFGFSVFQNMQSIHESTRQLFRRDSASAQPLTNGDHKILLSI